MEPIRTATVLGLDEETHVAAARRAVRDVGERVGLEGDALARAELVAVELGQNVLQHAGRGRMFCSSTVDGRGVQLIAADEGPGIGDLELAREDGFSTGTTLGFGLGAVERAATRFDLYSRAGKGTVISAVVEGTAGGEEECEECAVLSTAIEGETLNGDSWVVCRGKKRVVYGLVDGLGHGLYASEAAAMAREIAQGALGRDSEMGLEELVNRMHGPMKATRGAAIALVSVEDGRALCCGVGNISATLHGPDGTDRAMISNNGTVGHQMRRVQTFQYAARAGTLLLMHSDGLATKWRMGQFPGLARHAAATIAGVIYRDAVRGRDDATVLVARLGGGEA